MLTNANKVNHNRSNQFICTISGLWSFFMGERGQMEIDREPYYFYKGDWQEAGSFFSKFNQKYKPTKWGQNFFLCTSPWGVLNKPKFIIPPPPLPHEYWLIPNLNITYVNKGSDELLKRIDSCELFKSIRYNHLK